MKIISKFKDYYDTVQAHGVDDHVYWIRKSISEDIHDPNPLRIMERDIIKNTFFKTDIWCEHPSSPKVGITMHRWVFVGIAGKFYPAIEYRHTDASFEHHTNYIYSADDLIKYMDFIDPKKNISSEFMAKKRSNKHTPIYFRNNYSDYITYKEIDDYFTKHSGTTELYDMFVQRSEVILKIHQQGTQWKLSTNPVLDDLNFQKILDPYITYQEIEMFMGGVLGVNENPPETISDEHMRDAKGFDAWSFKKQGKTVKVPKKQNTKPKKGEQHETK